MSFKIQFLGATSTVTGSKYLVTYKDKKILIDCGLFQGLKSLRLKNWEPLPVDPSTIDAVLLTHAHIDHSGYLPLLVKNGFKGQIFSTAATKNVCEILLPDCGFLQEEEASYLNRTKRSKHSPALPLFTSDEAKNALEFFSPVKFDEEIYLGSDIYFRFRYAGHILGAASIYLRIGSSKITFSGDVGRFSDSIFYAPEPLLPTDYLIIESTYGNRLHPKTDLLEDLEKIINNTIQRNGVIIIPAFAVGRAQSLMFALSELRRQGRIPKIPMYLNSPMAEHFGSVFRKFSDLHKLTEQQCAGIDDAMTVIKTAEESKALNERKGPMLIISASGMLTGGRVLHHLKSFASDKRNTILLTGFQSAGTRGAALQDGATEIKIHGSYVPVEAEVKVLENISAHADYKELIQWLVESKIAPRKVFVTHGESSAADEFRRRLEESFGWNVNVPERNDVVSLETV